MWRTHGMHDSMIETLKFKILEKVRAQGMRQDINGVHAAPVLVQVVVLPDRTGHICDGEGGQCAQSRR